MSGGRKPDFTAKIRDAKAGRDAQDISLGAWWVEEGKLRGGWDKRVKRVFVLLDDGTRLDIQKGADGKWSHYLNARNWTEAPPSAPKRSAAVEPPPDPFGDDDSDIPF